MKIRWTLFLVLLAFTLIGCTSPQTREIESPNLPLSTLTPAQLTQGDSTQMNPLLQTPSTSDLEGLIEQAKEDLAHRLSIITSDISLVEAGKVTWPDGSLGCPQPGMMYTQALTPGYLIQAEI